MDVIAPLLTDPAAPRLTTYTNAGRMELSGETLKNWQSKVANLLLSLGVTPSSLVVLDAAAGWQPATIATGAWLVGATVVDGSVQGFVRGTVENATPPISSDATPPVVAFTDTIDKAEQLAESGIAAAPGAIEEVFVLSTDPFGLGVEESDGNLPFGLNDFSPEVRVQPDAFLGGPLDTQFLNSDRVLAASGKQAFTITEWQKAADSADRIICGPWKSTVQLAEVLSPWAGGGSVVMSTDTAADRLAGLASKENGIVAADRN